MNKDSAEVEWVVGRYTGTKAKNVLAQGHAGIGYSIIEEGKAGGESFVLAAFRRKVGEPLESHMVKIYDYKVIDNLERKMFPMNGRG